MPKKICGLGFNCGAMMQHPGIDPDVCLNYKTCGSATKLSEEEEFELVRVREEAAYRWREQQEERRRFLEEELERQVYPRRSAAIEMLMRRGCPQSLSEMGLRELIEQLEEKTAQIHEALLAHENQYIAPDECDLHVYTVKRPYKAYDYNKLTAHQDIFTPVNYKRWNKHRKCWEDCENVRTIHLSHDTDPRHTEAKAGIERRNALKHLRTQLTNSVDCLDTALTTFEAEMPPPFLYSPNDSASTHQ
jgi:hypothetical protein